MITYILRPSSFFVRFEHSVHHGLLMTTYTILLDWLVEHSCVQVPRLHESPQSHCSDNWEDTLFSWLHICYVFMLLWDLSTLCVMDHLWPLILSSLIGLLSTRVPKCPGYMSCHKAIVIITGRAYICVIAAGVTVSRGC